MQPTKLLLLFLRSVDCLMQKLFFHLLLHLRFLLKSFHTQHFYNYDSYSLFEAQISSGTSLLVLIQSIKCLARCWDEQTEVIADGSLE